MVEKGIFVRWGRRTREGEGMVWWERERRERRGENSEGGMVGEQLGGEVFGRV